MLQIKDIQFEVKSTEMNIKQRSYQGESIITAEIMTEFFPKMIDGDVLSGAIEIKLDMSRIKNIRALEHKHYHGKVGMVTLSVLKNGIWEHVSVEEFDMTFKTITDRKIAFTLKIEDPNCYMDIETTLVSLYTTNVNKLKEQFDLSDFYDTPIVREIGNSSITKYYVRETR